MRVLNDRLIRCSSAITAAACEMGCRMKGRKGMELVQVGILIAIAVGIGIIFKDKITSFINTTFSSLLGTSFN